MRTTNTDDQKEEGRGCLKDTAASRLLHDRMVFDLMLMQISDKPIKEE